MVQIVRRVSPIYTYCRTKHCTGKKLYYFFFYMASNEYIANKCRTCGLRATSRTNRYSYTLSLINIATIFDVDTNVFALMSSVHNIYIYIYVRVCPIIITRTIYELKKCGYDTTRHPTKTHTHTQGFVADIFGHDKNSSKYTIFGMRLTNNNDAVPSSRVRKIG